MTQKLRQKIKPYEFFDPKIKWEMDCFIGKSVSFYV